MWCLKVIYFDNIFRSYKWYIFVHSITDLSDRLHSFCVVFFVWVWKFKITFKDNYGGLFKSLWSRKHWSAENYFWCLFLHTSSIAVYLLFVQCFQYQCSDLQCFLFCFVFVLFNSIWTLPLFSRKHWGKTGCWKWQHCQHAVWFLALSAPQPQLHHWRFNPLCSLTIFVWTCWRNLLTNSIVSISQSRLQTATLTRKLLRMKEWMLNASISPQCPSDITQSHATATSSFDHTHLFRVSCDPV